jgi:hypothetical protein
MKVKSSRDDESCRGEVNETLQIAVDHKQEVKSRSLTIEPQALRGSKVVARGYHPFEVDEPPHFISTVAYVPACARNLPFSSSGYADIYRGR